MTLWKDEAPGGGRLSAGVDKDPQRLEQRGREIESCP
jgi:hypothetical protein